MIALWIALTVCAADADAKPAERVRLKEDYQVLQRDANDRASCVVALPEEGKEIERLVVAVSDDTGKPLRSEQATPVGIGPGMRGVVIENLALGGPYTITISAADKPEKPLLGVRRVLVGDIWILGGQSNMFGIDVIKEQLPELPYLNILNVLHVERDSHWCAGVPPIHRIPPTHAGHVLKTQHPEYSPEKIDEIVASQVPVGGIDCSYFFARQMYAGSRVPIGLIPCAMGSSIAIWDPRQQGPRYEFLLHQVARAGGRVKGMLFFQGEQDAIFGDKDQAVSKPSRIGPVSTYGEQFTSFVQSLREAVHDPSMPVIFAQICRHHNSPPGRAWAWESVRDQQRRLPDTLAHAHCIASVDLDVMDGLHLDYDSLRRVGERMARVALPYAKRGSTPRSEIRLKSVTRALSRKPRIEIQFTGVSGRLRAPGRPTGFVFKNAAGETFDWIFKAELDPARPDTVILWTSPPPGKDVSLYYAAGTAPYVNLVDDDDMPVSAFGPVAVE